MNIPFFFLHIPRTAGTTINSVLKNTFQPKEILSVYRDGDYKAFHELDPAFLDHTKLIQGHLLLHSYDPPQIYSREVRPFTFLRNPVDRLVSEYLFLKSWPDNHLYRYLNEGDVSFREYIQSDAKELRFRGKNFMTRAVSGMDFDVFRFPRQALETAKHHIEHVFGFVGIQERFDESLLLLREFLGLRSIFYEAMNAIRKDLKQSIGKADMELALECNAADMELHAFAVSVFEAKIAERGRDFARKLKAFQKINAKFGHVCALISKRTGLKTDIPIEMPKNLLFRS
ncbi:sulfotransferase family 2 domain-containing protein [Desulfolutivibrio sulfoxidireducens]|uniref:sulfotransferase family 2 domain-containing protein n=1 Tax=Desulfolutivibrio sulfoxidireducens TaxID=2773299 RepID=UPI00159D4DCF|nr:sulfotransferase family 2 domain-containing protein [Desulfolutivibrio sulfoxidireducens]QLA16810.1 calcium-binding protein [Desulfolutivibrio sulfoxidireducens]